MTESKAPAVVHPPSMLRGDIDDPKLAAALRTLELTVKQKLDGVLHGDHLGLIPGPGSEPGESRLYQPRWSRLLGRSPLAPLTRMSGR
ncbi:hypothetical protein J114_07945 [Mycobacterium tuberculosis EAI5/NITR206]|nr:hypothetical protein J114_07945 [Mycobacterium tuberculosis EAI5/NITR206]